jgi:hypothetical protein
MKPSSSPWQELGKRRATQQRPIPVTADIVEQKDFPIYRIGLGSVQALNTVTKERESTERYKRLPSETGKRDTRGA